jgi:hypothetical protein
MIPPIERKEGVVANVRDASSEIHRTKVESSVADVAAFLQDALGQKLVAHMVGVEDPKTVGRWASEKRLPQDPVVEQKLRAAYQVFRLLATQESPHTVRAWFVGLNPELDDESPAVAIHEGRMRDVLVAARAFLAGG